MFENKTTSTTMNRWWPHLLLLVISMVLLTACGEGSDSGNVETFAITGNSGGELRAFSPDIQSIMPALSTETTTKTAAATASEQDCDLSNWDSGWRMAADQSVLSLLLSTDDNAVWGALGKLDQLVETINNLTNQWDTEGSLSTGDTNKTITVNNGINQVWVPFYSGNVDVDRVITILDSQTRTRLQLAFADNAVDGEERLVAHYEKEDGSEAGVFYTWRDVSTGDLTVWHAHAAENNMNFKWTGNLEEGWFTISLVTNQCKGSFQLMGGGVMENVGPIIALMAQNNATGNSIEEWYTLLNLKNLTDGDTYPATPENTTRKPLQGDGITKFIATSENHPRGTTDWCPGWLTATDLPNGVRDIIWDN